MGEKIAINFMLYEYYNNCSKGYKYDFERCSFYLGPETFHSVHKGLVYSKRVQSELKQQIEKW